VTQAVTGRVIVGLLWLTILIVVAGVWSAGARPRALGSAPAGTRISLMPADAIDSDALAIDAASPPRLDLYGNEIDNAVGEYGIDIRGDLYERHSPGTEVTRLAAPSL
jgi:hypothetical protein